MSVVRHFRHSKKGWDAVLRHLRHPKKGEDAVCCHFCYPKKDQGQQDYKLAAERLEECKISEEQRPELPIVWA